MAEDDRISRREANLDTVLGRFGLALRKSGGGYQVVDAGTLKAVAGAQGPAGYSMSLEDAEDFGFMYVWAHRKAGRAEQVERAIKIAGWDPDSPHPGLPGGIGIVLSDSPPPEPQRRYVAVQTMGPRAKTVINTPTARAGLLEKCKHLSGDDDRVLWSSTRPSMQLCGPCWEASQMEDEQRCGFCASPVDAPARDYDMGMKVTDKLLVYCYLCSHCMDLDRAADPSP
jgi:hypothetical protein